MALPDVTLVIGTYNRLREIQMTVEALQAHLLYPEGSLRLLIADNHSPNGYINKLKKLRPFKVWPTEYYVTPETQSWGEKMNGALSTVAGDYVFYIEDDYVLSAQLDLRVGVALLETSRHIGLLRYGGTAGDHVVFHQLESDIGGLLPDWRDSMGGMGKLSYLQFDSGSPTAYLYSHRPHLKHRRFHEYYGLYDERRKLGATEEAYAIRVKAMQQSDNAGAPAIAILPEWIPMKWDHIGVSFQHTEADQ